MNVCTDVFRVCTNKFLRSNKFVSLLILLSIIIVLLVILILNSSCNCNGAVEIITKDKHMLCLIIPFRDRFDELLIFLPHMMTFLKKQNVKHHFYVVNQVDSFRFNRGSLINVGFLHIRHHSLCDYIAMHDVDLIPLNPRLSYAHPADSIMHIAAPDLHPKYHYKTFLGGILMMKNSHFELLNGLSNKYWGWGLEDDELYVRIRETKINIRRPEHIGSGIEDTFKHIHDKARRRRDMVKCFNQKEVTRRRDRQTGLHDVDYDIPSIYEINVNGSLATVLNVNLRCNHTITPWCDCKKLV